MFEMQTANGIRAYTNDVRDADGEWNSRLYKRCPPPRTEEDRVILTVNSSTRAGGFCLYRREFHSPGFF
ncbi:MAG: hypothetical protein EAZ49_18365 [Oscillatoriales cyanobacterium]|jgi:hypothetical protein|nr:MAG: hypothetical protein EAZ49_18365 [Oscillatoriales cyanobacterium]TAG73886.1 MAG: hypothetical protein EAZ23_08395 [Oscillatoriales cyanobacterium]